MLAEKLLPVAKGGATDPYFKNVTMLLPGNGTNGAQNNTFLDSSSNAFTITRNGNTTQGTFTPYGPDWSNYFDGSSYLTVSSAVSQFSTGDFTIEAWVYLTTLPSVTAPIFTGANAGLTSDVIQFRINPTGALYVETNNSNYATSTTLLVANQWYHVAAVRNGSGSNNIKGYINGVQALQYTDANAVNTGSTNNYIGTRGFGSPSHYLTGYISNLRVVKSAVYTSAFTPSTIPLTPITNTTLITCQSNRFVDNGTANSGAGYPISTSGTPSVQRFSPFNPTSAYSTSVIGGSGYFDGTGDYLSIASNAAFALGTGDFTIEFWLYPTSSYQRNVTFPTVGAPICYMNGSYQLQFENYGAPPSMNTTIALQANAWNHCVASRVSGTTRLFINGTLGATSSSFSGSNFVQSAVNIGTDAGTYYCNGYMSDVRIVKGSGVTSVTVPTAPLTAITNTSLLMNYTNAGIYDNAMMNDLETVGNAQISTAQKKYGTGSIAFDGTGDYLVSNTATTDLYALGAGDYTIEMWIYFNNVSTLGVFYDSRPASTNGIYPTLYVNSGSVYFYINSANEGSASVSTGQWYHLAVCRSSGTVKMFLNGTQSATWADTRSYLNSSGRPYIGTSGFGGGAGDAFNGYIDDLRITKGYARYTSNFTPPTSAFANK